MLRFITATSIIAIFVVSMANSFGQIARPANGASQSANMAGRAQIQQTAQTQNSDRIEQPLPPELERILQLWATSSSRIERLEGEHFRRVYDYTFGVEKVAQGKFYYEAPDKGRIDVTIPEPKQMAQLNEARAAGQIAAPKDKNGVMFQLKSDTPEKWICDGLRIFDMDVPGKQVDIMQLPPQLQGTNIMDSPLPFLFGMPPERARQRFILNFTMPFDSKTGYAMITAEPRMVQDANNWSKADIKLDLQTFLPVAIRLTDPPGTTITTYTFSNMTVNSKGGWKQLFGLSENELFKPDLRGWQVNMLGGSETPAVPNLVGMPYKNAVAELQKLGLNADEKAGAKTILLAPGPPARKADDIYKIESQDPKPGTPLTPETAVKLVLWNKPGSTN